MPKLVSLNQRRERKQRMEKQEVKAWLVHHARKQIWNAFFRDILRLPPSEREMTATEIIARKEEFIREIGPVFGRLETDYTAPIVVRSFHIMLRAGALAPIPEVLQGRSEMLLLAQAKPEALDLINVDALGRFSAEAAGLPNDIVNGADAVQQLRQQRAEAEAAAAQLEQLQAGVETAATAADAANKIGLTGEAA